MSFDMVCDAEWPCNKKVHRKKLQKEWEGGNKSTKNTQKNTKTRATKAQKCTNEQKTGATSKPCKEEEVAEVHEEAPGYVGLAHIARHTCTNKKNKKNQKVHATLKKDQNNKKHGYRSLQPWSLQMISTIHDNPAKTRQSSPLDL